MKNLKNIKEIRCTNILSCLSDNNSLYIWGYKNYKKPTIISKSIMNYDIGVDFAIYQNEKEEIY